MLGNLEGAFFFTRNFFASRPAEVELLAFDFGSQTPTAEPSVGPLVQSYQRFSLAEIEELGAALNAARLDLLLADVRKPHIYELLDLVDTPCVALLCAEVYLRFHPSVSFHLYPFQQADYFPAGGRLFCGTSAAAFGDEPVVASFFPYDLRGLDPTRQLCWSDREPLIVFHGRLFKVSPPFLEVILQLLSEDPALLFVLMGHDSLGALGRIRAAARRAGVADRVSYEGPLSTVQDEVGGLADPSWQRLFGLLGKARLAPDPWPLAGGATRVEAYAAGAPAVHMGIRTDRAHRGRAQPMVTAEHVALLVPRATAYSRWEYLKICRQALYDEEFADAIAAEQAELARRVGDPRGFWEHLLDSHDKWLRGELPRPPDELPVSVGTRRSPEPGTWPSWMERPRQEPSREGNVSASTISPNGH